MSRKVNQDEFLTKERGPIWNARVGVHTHLLEGLQIKDLKIRRWKIKEILN
jgi:hypothetical protein